MKEAGQNLRTRGIRRKLVMRLGREDSLMVSICIVGVYFGSFPDYFDLWLKSAEMNRTIEFMIFTDQRRDDLPPNVTFENMTIGQMRELATQKLGFPVCLERPYKCCDFKPAYGVIFEDYLTNVDYWGHCDFDLIWGNLRHYFDFCNLNDFDKFLPLGHLCLYKNNYENNRRFMLEGSSVGGYRLVFSDPHNFAFDELGGVYQIYKKNHFSSFDERIFADISKIYRRFRLALDDVNYDRQVFCWNNGHVYRYYQKDDCTGQDEFIYIHFKSRPIMPVHGNCIDSDLFYITPSGFYRQGDSGFCVTEAIETYNPFPGSDYERNELNRFVRSERAKRVTKRLRKILGLQEKLR